MGRTKELLEETAPDTFVSFTERLKMPMFPCYGTMVLDGSPILIGVFHVHEFPKKIAEALHMKEEEIDLMPAEPYTYDQRIIQFKVLVILPQEQDAPPLELTTLNVIFPTSIII